MPEKTVPKWTDSKKAIWDAYKASQKELSQKAQTTLNPTRVKETKRKKAVVEKVKPMNVEGVEKSIDTLMNRTESSLKNISEEMKARLEDLQVLQEAADIRKAEIEEIYGIEQEAETLAALIDAQAKQKEAFTQTMSEQKANFQDEIKRERRTWENEKEEYSRTTALQETRDQENRTREMETFKYNFARDERTKLDQLRDQLDAQKRAYDNQVELTNKALAEREEAITKKEAEYADLQAKVLDFPNQLEAGKEEAKKRASQSYGIEVNAIKKSYEADIKVLQANVTNLTDDKADLQRQLSETNAELKNAYNKVQDVAVQALSAQGSANTVAQVQSAVSAATGNKNR